MDKEQLKLEKKIEREKNKMELERQKKLSKAMSTQIKNQKPEMCCNFISVIIDQNLENKSFTPFIINKIKELGAKYKFEFNLIPNSIIWSRLIQTHLVTENGQLSVANTNEDTGELLVLMQCSQMVEKIADKSFVSYLQSIQEICSNKRISLGLLESEKYFKWWKQQKNKSIRARVTGSSEDISSLGNLKIDREEIEFALTELQILFNCSSKLLDTDEKVSQYIGNFTKSIAQIPYKLEKQKKYQQNEKFMLGDNKDCVNVDKFGNGLQRLWKQQLTCFSLVGLETAEAITSEYPSLALLMEKYKEGSGEHLLQDISIRRGAGPITSVRKVGPEFSKKMFQYCTNNEPNFHI